MENLRQRQGQMRQQYDLDRQQLYNEQMQQQQQEQGAAGYDSPWGAYYTGSAAGDNMAAAMRFLGGEEPNMKRSGQPGLRDALL